MANVIIMGAAGRDFHNFNVYFRDNSDYNVVCFTATQIPDIASRKYPSELAGARYPEGIPISHERELPELIKKFDVDEVILAYSDLPYDYVMRRSALVNSLGADFKLMGPKHTMLTSSKPVIAVCAVRTGCGKSQTSRRIFRHLRQMELKAVAIRHPMPYGDLRMQVCQRFASYDDLDKHNCTIEEREEYEPYIDMDGVVYAGVDYEKILRAAEQEADVIIWDGGNNDFPFIRPELHIVVVDPHRPGDEMRYYPGEVNLRMADVIVINKMDSAAPAHVVLVRRNIKDTNPKARVIEADSVIAVDEPSVIRRKKVLVIEDGPTLTHGGMSYGAGFIAAKDNEAEIIDPRPYAVGSIKETYEKYTHLDKILPAMGYGERQIRDLTQTIKNADCEGIVIGTPIDLRRLIELDKPSTRVSYELRERQGSLSLKDILEQVLPHP